MTCSGHRVITSWRGEALPAARGRRRAGDDVRLPDDDAVRESFRSVKKSVNSLGQSRFDAEHDSTFGHADHWWAFCMAEAAAERPSSHLAGVGAVVGRPLTGGIRDATF